MPTAPTDFTNAGMAPVAAEEVATQIDETAASTAGYPNAALMTGVGLSGPLADEIATQASAGTGNASNLMGLGLPALLAQAVDDAIDAANA